MKKAAKGIVVILAAVMVVSVMLFKTGKCKGK